MIPSVTLNWPARNIRIVIGSPLGTYLMRWPYSHCTKKVSSKLESLCGSPTESRAWRLWPAVCRFLFLGHHRPDEESPDDSPGNLVTPEEPVVPVVYGVPEDPSAADGCWCHW